MSRQREINTKYKNRKGRKKIVYIIDYRQYRKIYKQII